MFNTPNGLFHPSKPVITQHCYTNLVEVKASGQPHFLTVVGSKQGHIIIIFIIIAFVVIKLRVNGTITKPR